MNKLDIFNNYVTLVHTSTNIFLISEAWLNAAVPDSLVCPNEYYILYCDRKSGCGGGVMMLYKNNLKVTFTTPSSKYDDVEFIVADLNTNKSLSKMTIICVYISLNTASNSANVENFCNILYNYVCVNFPVFIVGDFKMPTIDWSIPATSAGKNQQVFLKFCTDNALKQLISEPTH